MTLPLQSLLKALTAVLTIAWGVMLVQEITGLGRWRSLPMGGAKKFESRENRWLWHLPRRYATHLTELTGRLTEDGKPLFRAASHRDVRQHGAGRFRLHGRLVSFAAWDDSDPNTNGRQYVFHAPRSLSPWLLWGGFATVIGAHAVTRRMTRHATVFFPTRRGLESWWRHPAVFGAALLVISLTVRGMMVATDPHHNDGIMMARGMPYSDAAWWLDMARSMAEGHGLTGPSDGQRPVYAVLLAPLIWLGLEPVATAQWVNVILGAGTASLFGVLMARLAGPLVGIAAAAFLTAGGMQAKMLPLPMSETAALALLASALALLWRGAADTGRRDLFLGGLFFGLSNLTCPFTLLALPLVGVAAAVRHGGWTHLLRRGAWVAAGASLVIVPWLVRQKLTHGMATISLNGPQMLYATVSPSGRYDTAILAPIIAASIPEDPASQAHVYARRFSEAVRRDPGLYFQRLGAGFAAWWEKFDPQHPMVLLVLMAGGMAGGLSLWWRGGGAGALVAVALVPLAVLAAGRLPGWSWVALATAGALGTRDRRCWRLVAMAAAVVLGCAAMNALTSGALANRLWVMADWLVVGLALLALHHAVTALAGWRRMTAFTFATTPTLSEASLPGLNATALAQAGWVVGGGMLTLALAVRGPATRPALPTPSPAVQQAAVTDTLDRNGLSAQLTPDSPLLSAVPVRLDGYRSFLPARESIGHWSRAFAPRNHTRTVAHAVSTEKRRLTLQIPGDARDTPAGPWLAVGVNNRDPAAFLGAEIEMLEVLALWPLTADGETSAPSDARFYPVPSTVRTLVRRGTPE